MNVIGAVGEDNGVVCIEDSVGIDSRGAVPIAGVRKLIVNIRRDGGHGDDE